MSNIIDSAEHDVLAYMTFPRQHWAKLHSTNPIERLNGEIKRRTEVVGIFPTTMPSSDWSVPLLLEQNDEWVVQRSRYMTLETIATRAMIRSLACQTQADPFPALSGRHGDSRSYTTTWDTMFVVARRSCLLRWTLPLAL